MKTVISRLTLALALLTIAISCERRPLYDLTNTHYIRVYVDEHLLNVTEGFYDEDNIKPLYKSPQVMRVVLSDPETGKYKADRFLRNTGRDNKGLYFDGYIIADPGKYDLYAYNFDTEASIVRNANDYKLIDAYTNEIASHLRSKLYSRSKGESKSPTDERIVYDADHLFAASCKDVVINYSDHIDTLWTPAGEHFQAESIVKSYYIQIKVKGMKYVSSAVAVLGGMAGSSSVTSRQMNVNDPVSVFFEMTPGGDSQSAGVRAAKTSEVKAGEEDIMVIYNTFGTFGKIPQSSNPLEITFDFMTVYGTPYTETLEIEPVFQTEDAIKRQWLLIEKTIVIPEPPRTSGGFNPAVEDWGDKHIDILI